MAHIMDAAPCVEFVGRTDEADYLEIDDGGPGCYAYPLGYVRRMGRHMVNLSQRQGCAAFRVVVHEFLHTLGSIHEHTRPDRDAHVRIAWDRISGENHVQFWKVAPAGPPPPDPAASCTRAEGPDYGDCFYPDRTVAVKGDPGYDLGSIMHYHDTASGESEKPAKGTPG